MADRLRLRSLRVLVAGIAVALTLAGAGLVGGAAWLTSLAETVAHEQFDRSHLAQHVAGEARRAHRRAGGWRGAGLEPAVAAAEAGGAALAVFDGAGRAVRLPPEWTRSGPAPAAAQASRAAGGGGAIARVPDTSAPVVGAPDSGWETVSAEVVRGRDRLGAVVLLFEEPMIAAMPPPVPWLPIAGAVVTLAALAVAVAFGGRMVRPLERLAETARRFASGDRTARAAVSAPGELGELARDFDRMAEEVTRSEAERREMAADLAHELRTPLAVLQAGLEELRDGLIPADRDSLGRLHAQAARLGNLVADLSQLSSSAPFVERVTVERIDLAEIVLEEVASRGLQSAEAGVLFDTGAVVPVKVLADADRVHQIVGNILTNALTYCRRGDRVSIATGVRAPGRGSGPALSPGPVHSGVSRTGTVSGSTQQDRPAGLFTCSDTGPGIDPVDLPRVCERSWRGSRWRPADIDPDLSTGEGRATGSVPCVRETAAQTLTAARSGSGLGLAVAKRLAESQRGSVEVDSDGRSGTVVRVALPLANG